MNALRTFESDLDRLIAGEYDDLLQAIGEDALPPALGMAERPRSSLVDAGRRWWEENRGEIENRLCGSLVVKTYLSNPSNENRLLIAAAMCDLLVGLLGSVSPVTVVAMIFHEGIESFCPNR